MLLSPFYDMIIRFCGHKIDQAIAKSKLNPTSDPDGIFPSASHGNASYFHGISTDPPDAPAVRHDKYQIFIGCTAGTVLIFALVYGLIYLMTAKSYYHIVERR